MDSFKLNIKEFYPCINFSFCNNYVFINEKNPIAKETNCVYCNFVLNGNSTLDNKETKQKRLEEFIK